ncbi:MULTISPECIES: hypothetical protein [Halomonas]|uniref:hypothetical protein n=1 Tax=Halomonas TaxID=2745 RepID=UPI003CE6F359
MKINADFDALAKQIMFSGTSMTELADQGFIFRKGFNQERLTRAIQKGLKDGRGRTEAELSMVALQLSFVFKKHLSLTPSVIREHAVRLKNATENMATMPSKERERLLNDVIKLSMFIPLEEDHYDLKVASMALDIIATRNSLTLKFC